MWIRTLDAAEPRRLVLRDGRWTLELEELVRFFGSVYRPVRHELSGQGPILELLGHAPSRSRLREDASRLFGAPPDVAAIVYDAHEGAWQPRPPAEDVRLLKVPGRFARRVRSDALGLRQVRERSRRALLSRRRELREGVTPAFPAAPSVGSGDPISAPVSEDLGPDPVEEYAEEQPRLKPFSAADDSEPPPPRRRASIPLATPPGSDAQSAEAQPDAAIPEAEASAPEIPEAEPPCVRFPPAAALSDNLTMLLGEEPELEELRGDAVELSADLLAGAHVVPLLDADEEVRGLWIVDAFASQALGAGLRSLPAEERALLQDAADVDAGLLDATAEILGTLVGALAAVEGNPRLHAGELTALDVAAHTWLDDARERLALSLEGYGRVIGLSR